jgi:hypothetical protein
MRQQTMPQARQPSREEIKSVALLIRQSATDIAIAMINSGQWGVNSHGVRSADWAFLAVEIARAISIRSFEVAPDIIETIDRQANEGDRRGGDDA